MYVNKRAEREERRERDNGERERASDCHPDLCSMYLDLTTLFPKLRHTIAARRRWRTRCPARQSSDGVLAPGTARLYDAKSVGFILHTAYQSR